jgi:hypothetical protein
MRVTQVQYSRLKNLGDYDHEKIGVEVEISEGETAAEALTRAKRFVDAELDRPDMPSPAAIAKAKVCIANFESMLAQGTTTDDWQNQQYNNAQEILSAAKAASKPIEEF